MSSSSIFSRQSQSSSGAAALAKRPPPPAAAEAAENPVKAASAPQQAKKRVALGNLTNQSNTSARNKPERTVAAKGSNANAASSLSKLKKGPVECVRQGGWHQNKITPSFDVKPTILASSKDTSFPVNGGYISTVRTCFEPCTTAISPSQSGDSISVDESMSTCDSMKSPDFEYIDNGGPSSVASLERRASNNLHISKDTDAAGYILTTGPAAKETSDKIIDVDDDKNDPQLCAALACDIYKHLRIAEIKKRPSMDFMERIQKDINASMRAILVDWLVEVAEEYRLVPDTLYLAVNYIDRYLSGNEMNRQQLQLLGVACMLIASKYEEICAPQVEEFCFITDNTYFKDEVLQMEADVLKYLKFEMTAPTIKCFLRRFVRVAQGCDEVPLLQLEFLANYVAELSLLEYEFLCYSPSLVAAASVFLARFILRPTKQPWNATLGHYSLYKPSELCDCTKALHCLFFNSPSNSLPAIREKYSQHKYKFVAKKYCPSSIPSEFFQESSS